MNLSLTSMWGIVRQPVLVRHAVHEGDSRSWWQLICIISAWNPLLCNRRQWKAVICLGNALCFKFSIDRSCFRVADCCFNEVCCQCWPGECVFSRVMLAHWKALVEDLCLTAVVLKLVFEVYWTTIWNRAIGQCCVTRTRRSCSYPGIDRFPWHCF